MDRKIFTETSPHTTRTYADEVLCTALDIGESLLECGAEIQRVEDTIQRICFSYGADHVEVFAITAMITASVRMPDGDYASQMRRVYGSSNDFRKLEDLNALSRTVCKEPPSIETVQKRIHEIRYPEKQKPWTVYFGALIATSAFAIFFGGNWMDAVASGLIGLLMQILGTTLLSKTGPFAKTLVSSFVGGLLAELAVFMIPGMNVDKIMIATIMLLIPGGAFCNSLRDLFSGDTFAGSARLVQSILLALTIASGFSIAILLFGGIV